MPLQFLPFLKWRRKVLVLGLLETCPPLWASRLLVSSPTFLWVFEVSSLWTSSPTQSQKHDVLVTLGKATTHSFKLIGARQCKQDNLSNAMVDTFKKIREN